MNETIFIKNLKKDNKRLEIFNKAYKMGLIQPFDQEVLTKLRRLYYSCIPGILYLFGEPTDFETISNKARLLTYVFENEEYDLVHADIDSIKNIKFFEYNHKHLDYNSYLEVKKGNKVWIYDTFSMLKFDKGIYDELEHPSIRKRVPKMYIVSHPGREEDDFYSFKDEFLLAGIIRKYELELKKNPFKNMLKQELSRFKQEVKYDEIILKCQQTEEDIRGRSL